MIFLLLLGPLSLTATMAEPPAASPSKPVTGELSRHQGTWSVVTFERDGKQTPRDIARSIVRIVDGDRAVWKREGKSFAATQIEVSASGSPATIDVLPEGGPSRGKRILGIYKIEGDTLTICMADPDQPRPTSFKADPNSKHTLMTFERKKTQ